MTIFRKVWAQQRIQVCRPAVRVRRRFLHRTRNNVSKGAYLTYFQSPIRPSSKVCNVPILNNKQRFEISLILKMGYTLKSSNSTPTNASSKSHIYYQHISTIILKSSFMGFWGFGVLGFWGRNAKRCFNPQVFKFFG